MFVAAGWSNLEHELDQIIWLLPPVVQRKIREAHHWDLLAARPLVPTHACPCLASSPGFQM
jgi:hypothetical protein